MDDVHVTTASLLQRLVANCSQSQSEGGWETAFLLLLFSDQPLRQSSTAPKLRYHHHSSVVEWGGLKRNDGQHQLATFCLHANCLQEPTSFTSRYNFLLPCCAQTSSSFKCLGAGAYEEGRKLAHIPSILGFCSEYLFPFHLTSGGVTVFTHPTHLQPHIPNFLLAPQTVHPHFKLMLSW